MASASGGGLVVAHGELRLDFCGVSFAQAPVFKNDAGSAPANVAVGVARLGGNAAFIGKVGDDEPGHMLADVLETNKVNVQGLRFDSHERTALAFDSLKSCGERQVRYFGRKSSADMLMDPAELDEGLIRRAAVFHYGSITLIADRSRETHLAAMRIAVESGSLMSYAPNVRVALWPSPEAAREGIQRIWNDAHIIKVSAEEVHFLTNGGDDEDDEVVRSLFHDNLKLLVVTDGPVGCRYYTPKFEGSIDSYKVTTIDPTGAGDAFVAALLHRLANNQIRVSSQKFLESALQFACACAAITTTARGVTPAMPDMRSAVKLILENMDSDDD